MGENLAQQRGDEQKDIPPDKICEEYLDWFDLGQTCIKMIGIGKPNEDSGQMIENFKMETCDKLENMLITKPCDKLENMLTAKPCDKLDKMLISTPLKTPKTEQEYEKSDPEMKTKPMDSDYEIDSGINSDYDSTDSEIEKKNWSNETNYKIVKEGVNNNREVDKSLESNETILENNRKLIQALEIEMAKYKQVRSKFNSAQQELQTAEITVKEL